MTYGLGLHKKTKEYLQGTKNKTLSYGFCASPRQKGTTKSNRGGDPTLPSTNKLNKLLLIQSTSELKLT